MSEYPNFEVKPESLREDGTLLHGIVGEYNGKPVVFIYDSSAQNIIVPEELEPIYPAIEKAVVQYLKENGKL